MTTVSIVGVTSYTGMELLRLLSQHPHFVVTSATARSASGKRLADIYPQLNCMSGVDHTTPAVDPALIVTEEAAQTELAFVCLPHAAAAEPVVQLVERGIKVVDLSADFRLHDVRVYEEWYNHTHPAPALLESAVYGLCERYRERIGAASLVANPGCHATAAILALIPAMAAGIIEPDVIIDSKSGISGAGRTPALPYQYAEANEDVSVYKLEGHRHMPEIAQELEAAAVANNRSLMRSLRLTFIPHLIPMTRGILATCYADIHAEQQHVTTASIQALYKEYYAHEPFVHVVDQAPHTKWTYGSNHCIIHPFLDERTRRLVVIACLDNLVKGAAGQAIQNANRLCGLPETSGLLSIAVNP